MSVIRTMYPGAPDSVNFMRSNWGNDPNAYGAWAYIKAGGTPEDCDIYAESDSTGGKVFFAGEATNSQMIGTVHGAYISGQTAANDAYASINGGGDE